MSEFDPFSLNLKRAEILHISKNLDLSKCQNITINIHRNHAFEPISAVMKPFLHFANLAAKFRFSDYDDSVNFANFKEGDLELIWLDLARYKSDVSEFLSERILFLSKLSKAPILVLLLDFSDKGEIIKLNLSSNLAQILPLSQILSPQNLDLAKLEFTGTRLGNNACLKMAQILGLKLIPSAILPSLKAIVCDLDNTLYSGILGEDGAENLALSPAHKALQEKILFYKNQGFLLAIASKNDEKDVREMFEKRTDFVLKFSDFDAVFANWDAKSENLKLIAKAFNIALDAMLFIDDNIAEIEAVKNLGVKFIYASSPSEVLRRLELFAQMQKATINREDTLRAKDIAMNKERENLATLPTSEYFSALKIKLKFSIKPNAARTHELLNKTNQFIANYTRPTQRQVEAWLGDANTCVVGIEMSDKLSDSGNIAILVGQKSAKCLKIIDLCVSCRALGRKLEQIMLFKAFEIMQKKLEIQSKIVEICYQKGERNEPFLRVLAEICGELKSEAKFELKSVDLAGLDIIIKEQ